jgi:outer membrane lipoprotein-sorting protein
MLAGRLLSLAAAVLLAAAVVAPLAAPPATAATPSPSPSLDAIVARHVKARGGMNRLHGLQSLRQAGAVTASGGRQALVTREVKRPGKIRFEFTVQGVTAVSICDGERGWQVSPLEGEIAPTALPDEVVREAMEQADLEGPLVDWKAKGSQLELVGREALGDREVYRLKLTLRSGAVQDLYLDAKSYLVVCTDSTRTIKGWPVRIRTVFADYRKTKEIPFPHRVETMASERPGRLLIQLDRVEVNPALPDSLFVLTEPARP